MFQVHLVCPHEESDQLVGLLTADAGVRNIVVLPASARRPAGDMIQFDLATDSANPVLRQLRDLGIGKHSPVAVNIVGVMRVRASPVIERVASRRAPSV